MSAADEFLCVGQDASRQLDFGIHLDSAPVRKKVRRRYGSGELQESFRSSDDVERGCDGSQRGSEDRQVAEVGS